MKSILKPLAIAAMSIAMLAPASAMEMPKALTGQWCQVASNGEFGDYIKAKHFCRADRPVAFDVHSVGFWITLANIKTRIICVPIKIEPWAHGWNVTADCGAEDLSTAVYRMGFTFEPDTDKAVISRWKPQDER
jgi:hypothetical protein